MPRAKPSWLVCTIRSSPSSRAVLSRKAIMSRNFQVVSMCKSGNGGLPGQKACAPDVAARSNPYQWNRAAPARGIVPRPHGRCGCSRSRVASDAKRARSCGLSLAARVHMQPALLLLFVLPPPAAGARMLARLHRARARLAADGDEAARVQRIHRYVVLGDVSREPLRRPIGDRIDLE